MFEIECRESTLWDELREEFIEIPSCKLKLEHSLLSISKWESIHHKPFLSETPMTLDETISYIECMTINRDVPKTVYSSLTDQIINSVNEYIRDSHTATTINKNKRGRASRQIVTSELIYYWMIDLGIPFECEKWNFNRLMTLIDICAIKNAPEKKMTKKSIMEQNRALNSSRLKRSGRKG